MKRPTSLRERALALLARREYSRAELASRLEAAGAPEAVAAELDRLEGEGYLSDRRFFDLLVRSRRDRYGLARIAGEARAKGVAAELIQEMAPELQQGELATAQAAWAKKFGECPTSPRERARQYRYLAYRGFSAATIRQVLGGADIDDV